jgi:hypothetical protein
VPAFTDGDAPAAYGARVRFAFGAETTFREAETTASRSTRPELPRPWTFGVASSPAGRSVFATFGTAGAKTFEIGTYSCADADARIYEAEWNADGTAKPARDASACSIVVDRIVAGPSAKYARAYGRFEAKAGAGEAGLSTDLRGAFLADFPIAP